MRCYFLAISCFIILGITSYAKDRYPHFVLVEGKYCLWFGESKQQVWEEMNSLNLFAVLEMSPGGGSLYYHDIEINYQEWDECELKFDAQNKLYLVKLDKVYGKKSRRDSLYNNILKRFKNNYGTANNTDRVQVEPSEKIVSCRSATFMNTVTLSKYASPYFRDKLYYLQLLYSTPPEAIHKTRGIQTSFFENEFGASYSTVANRLSVNYANKYQLYENNICLKDVSFGGYKWPFFDFIFNPNSLLSKIEMQYPFNDKEEATERFEMLSDALTAKYGNADFHNEKDNKNILAFRDNLHECWLELSYEESKEGEMFHYCILTYIATELNQQISEEL